MSFIYTNGTYNSTQDLGDAIYYFLRDNGFTAVGKSSITAGFQYFLSKSGFYVNMAVSAYGGSIKNPYSSSGSQPHIGLNVSTAQNPGAALWYNQTGAPASTSALFVGTKANINLSLNYYLFYDSVANQMLAMIESAPGDWGYVYMAETVTKIGGWSGLAHLLSCDTNYSYIGSTSASVYGFPYFAGKTYIPGVSGPYIGHSFFRSTVDGVDSWGHPESGVTNLRYIVTEVPANDYSHSELVPNYNQLLPLTTINSLSGGIIRLPIHLYAQRTTSDFRLMGRIENLWVSDVSSLVRGTYSEGGEDFMIFPGRPGKGYGIVVKLG